MDNTYPSITNANFDPTLLMGVFTSSAGTHQLASQSVWLLPLNGVNQFTAPLEGNIASNFMRPMEARTPASCVHEAVAIANSVIGIGKYHIAEIFGMSRQNLYNIMADPKTTPKDDTQERAFEVAKALHIIEGITPHMLGASTMTVKIDGDSLLDVLKEQTINLERVESFANAINASIANLQKHSALPQSLIEQQEFMDNPGTS